MAHRFLFFFFRTKTKNLNPTKKVNLTTLIIQHLHWLLCNWIRVRISAATLSDFSPQGLEEWEVEGEEERLQSCGRQSAWGPGPVAECEAWISKPNDLLQWRKTHHHRCGDLHLNRPPTTVHNNTTQNHNTQYLQAVSKIGEFLLETRHQNMLTSSELTNVPTDRYLSRKNNDRWALFYYSTCMRHVLPRVHMVDTYTHIL